MEDPFYAPFLLPLFGVAHLGLGIGRGVGVAGIFGGIGVGCYLGRLALHIGLTQTSVSSLRSVGPESRSSSSCDPFESFNPSSSGGCSQQVFSYPLSSFFEITLFRCR